MIWAPLLRLKKVLGPEAELMVVGGAVRDELLGRSHADWDLATLAVREGWTRFVWQVLDWNTPAIEFYEAHGAKVMRPWLTCRVEGEALNRLARGVDCPGPRCSGSGRSWVPTRS